MNGIFCLILPFFVNSLQYAALNTFPISHLQPAPVGQQTDGVTLFDVLHLSPTRASPLHQLAQCLHQPKLNFGQSIFQFFQMNEQFILE